MDGLSDLGRERLWTHSRVMLLTASFDGTIREVNPAWTALLGWTPDRLIGTNFFDFIHPEDIERTQIEAQALAKGDRQVPKFENRYRHSEGGYRDIDWTAVSDGEFIHAIGRDITTEKAHAQTLKAAEEAVRQSQKMEAIGQLTGGVAHDFNNLLTIIRASADLLRRSNLSEARRARYIEAISDTADRGARLTSQLLAFARKQSLKPEIFGLAQTFEGLGDMVRTLVGSRVAVDVRFDCDECFIEADFSQFETAIINLAVNARDAMEGEGTLTIGVRVLDRLPAMRTHPATDGNYVAVSITDTGSGIAAADLANIFEPFFTTKEVGKGTGLGLSQVYGFAKQSGGNVSVESELGAGTTFTLFFPRRDGVRTPRVIDSAAVVRPRAGTRVLVVEDNREVAEFSTQLLADLGYDTVWAADGQTAIEMIGVDRGLDLVFTDVVMPGMTGIELARRVRETRPDLPVVLTSGYSHILAEEGTHGFRLLRKPYSVEALSAVLQEAAKGN